MGAVSLAFTAHASPRSPEKEMARAKEQLSERWTPPEKSLSEVAPVKKRRMASPPAYGRADKVLSDQPSRSELTHLDMLPEPLMSASGASTLEERRALATALKSYMAGQEAEAIQPLVDFTVEYPNSIWTPGLKLNLGLIAYDTGYFSDALDFWEAAWNEAKTKTDRHSVAVANRAIAEYAKMCARIGRKDALAAVFDETVGRTFQGTSRILLDSAREGFWTMQNKGGIAYRCGPYALTNVASELLPGSEAACAVFLEEVVSPDTGFSLHQVQAMSSQLGLNMQMAKRSAGAEVIIPSVVHWKVGHYGALTRELNGKYLLKDPTFGNETWMSIEAIDQESSGYFIVPAGDLSEGWEEATDQEASVIFGRGHSGNGGEEETACNDHQSGGECGGLAMATYSFHTLLASLSIEDTPVGYPPAYGPDVRVRVNYNQREFGQPSLIAYTSFSPQWVCNWVSYLEDNPSSPGANITLYLRGGGSEIHTDFDALTQTYGRDVQTSVVLVRLTANTYKKVFPDGTEHYYEHYIGTTGSQRKVFLSKIVDPQGNAVTLQYDTTYATRLKYIHDATGLSTEFFYTYSGEPYLVTEVEDPYGRTALFTYNSVSGAVRLTEIEDIYGIVSSFGYNANGDIDMLTTPYGTTTFELSDFDLGNYSLIRYIEATDPYGDKERIEYNLSDDQTGLPQNITNSDEPLPDSSIVAYRTSDNDDRNSFYWDKQQMKYGAGDYSKAHLYHWVQPDTADAATSILESEKSPLEGRIWYNYPGQPQPYIQGDLGSPSVVARVVEDETGNLVTRATRYEYNDLGNLTKQIDPEGRETLIEYAANGIDVLFIKQRTGGTESAPVYSTLASYTYNPADPAHRPRTYTDSAGNTMTFTYTSEGQTQTVTNELNEVITFTYETNINNNGYGKVLTITGDVPDGNVTYTYDSFDRIRTATDSEGHTLTYDYDALDRVSVITYPDTSYEQFDYENHSLVASRDREGRWTRYFHDALMRPILERDPLGQLTQYEWCRCGHIRKLIDGEGSVTHWVRDVQGRVTEKRFADGTKQSYLYYPQSGQLQMSTDALNQTATRSYFADGNLESIDYSAANTPDESFMYGDWYDRLTSMTDGIGTTSFVYHPTDGATNGGGLIARVDGPFTDDTIKYTYDELQRLQKREIVDDATFSVASYSEEYVFDARSRVEDIINDLGTFDYYYVGQSGRIDYMDYPNGMKTDYTYTNVNGDHLIQQIQHLNSAGTPGVISQFDYTYRQDRNIETWTTTQNSTVAKKWTFGYDDALRLATAVRNDTGTQAVLEQFTYGYDKAGNRTSVTTGSTNTNYPANTLNQTTSEQGFGETVFSGTLDEPALVTVNSQPAKVMSTAGSAPYTFEALVDLAEGSNTVTIEATDGNGNVATQSYSVTAGGVQMQLEYDLNGNLRYEKDASGTVLREFEWDAKNRLLKIIDGTHESEFAYDGLDRRVRIIETDNSIEQSNLVFVWDNRQIAQRRASNGSSVERSYYGHGFVEGTADYFYTKDHLGSIREVVASDGTTIEAVYDYSPWGEVSKIGGSGVESDFLYTGHFYNDESDLHLTLYRAYNPELGMWLSRDPIAENGGINLYAYVGNNPVNFWDPFGLCEVYSTGEAFWIEGAHHLYAENPETGERRGRAGSFGNPKGGGGMGTGAPGGPRPPSHIHVATVDHPEGVSHDDFMRELDATAERGMFFPNWNDCHTSIERAAENTGSEIVWNENYEGRFSSGGRPESTRMCFVAGTQIEMADGTTRSIEDITIGDEVLSWNTESNEIGAGVVIDTYKPMHRGLVFLDFGSTSTTNTADHPFWVKGKGWCSISPKQTIERYETFGKSDIKPLLVGDVCYQLKNGHLTEITLESTTQQVGRTQTYNIKVENTSTYFANEILVHNK